MRQNPDLSEHQQLGFKNPKWITAIEVTNTFTPGYWEKQGPNWFAGL